ncbi:AlpA family transcriptional regulator [Tropicimonas sp. IMCC6043]|uniref:helix-turn-helix transcriptional regulator n=1 Tax=Tropicimonas sp. IMCC6043 TaxID=2510645 RepID=UPI00101B82E4|nr:AlpA family transcriptional regulator [Tropicimonas sp. IMCC6043]RYH06098.1 AlpA family phage regulatory protein [Tropicimonas sp. IMCC6043]
MPTSHPQQNDRFQRRPMVEQMTGLSRSSIYAKMDPRSPHHDPDFPKPVRLGKRAVAWRESDILAWMNGRQSTGV